MPLPTFNQGAFAGQRHTYTVIFHLYDQESFRQAAAQGDAAALDARRRAMLMEFSPQLQPMVHAAVESQPMNLHHVKFVATEAHHLDVEIVVDEFHLIAESTNASPLRCSRRRMLASFTIGTRAMSGSKRTSDAMEFKVLNKK